MARAGGRTRTDDLRFTNRSDENDARRRKTTPEQPAAIAKLHAEQRKRVATIRKLNARYAGQPFPKRAAERWNRLSRELDETQELITQLRARCEAHRGA